MVRGSVPAPVSLKVRLVDTGARTDRSYKLVFGCKYLILNGLGHKRPCK
jgi:hypothetical protein